MLPRADRTEDGWLAETAAALTAVARRGSLAGGCVLGLPGHLTFSRVVELPRVTARQRRRIIGFEVRQGIPLPLAEVVWAQAAAAESSEGPEIVLTAAKRSMIEALWARLRANGLYPVAALPAWLVLRRGLASGDPATVRTLAVGIGARSTQLVFAGAAGSCIRTLALGGDTVTEKIVGELGLDFAHAEALKVAMPDGVAATATAERERVAVRSAMDEFSRRLGGEILRSLARLGSESFHRPDRVCLSGRGAQIEGLPQRLAEHLGLPVGRRVPAQNLAGDGQGQIATALLADLADLAAAHRRPPAVNLLPWSLRWATFCGRRRWALTAAVLLLAFAPGGAIWRERVVAAEAHRQAAALGEEVARLRQTDARNRENLERLGAIRRRTAALQRLVEAKRCWISFLADLQERLNRIGDAWLEKLDVALPPLPKGGAGAATARAAPGVAVPDVRIGLAGCLFDPENPLGPVGEGSYGRARGLLTQFRESPFVAGLEDERFDNSQPGVLRFEVTLLLAPGKVY